MLRIKEYNDLYEKLRKSWETARKTSIQNSLRLSCAERISGEEKQKQAIELAIKRGYYTSPRKISLQELAKISKLSFSTFQVHLRKAEEKLIPFYFE